MAGQRNTHKSGPVYIQPGWDTRSQPVQRPFLPPVPVRHSTTEQLPVQRPASLSQPAVRPEPGPAPRAIVPYAPPPPPAPRVPHRRTIAPRRRIVEPRRRSRPAGWPTLTLGLLAVSAVLLLATLNCALFVLRSQSTPETDGYDYVVMVDRLPTLTPTANAVAVAQVAAPVEAAPQEVAPSPTPTFTATPSPTPLQSQPVAAVEPAAPAPPTPTPTPWPTPVPAPTNPPPTAPVPAAAPLVPGSVAVTNPAGGWSFAATRVDSIPAQNLVILFGEMTNESDQSRQLLSVRGDFYDDEGGLIAADRGTRGIWPVDIVPPRGRIPFALVVQNIQNVASFELSVQSQSADTPPRQDFEFVTVNEQKNDNSYCLTGSLKNPGGQLGEFLVVTATLYDEQGNVLRFGDYNKFSVRQAVGDNTPNFELCFKSPPGNIARHELHAWGI